MFYSSRKWRFPEKLDNGGLPSSSPLQASPSVPGGSSKARGKGAERPHASPEAGNKRGLLQSKNLVVFGAGKGQMHTVTRGSERPRECHGAVVKGENAGRDLGGGGEINENWEKGGEINLA